MEVVEHMTKRDGYRLLSEMERVSHRKIILSTPNRHLSWRQREERLQHKSHWTPSDFKKLGYKVRGIGFYFRKLTLGVPLIIPYIFPWLSLDLLIKKEKERENNSELST